MKELKPLSRAKLKAYYDTDIDGYTFIVWAENANEAKALLACECDKRFIEVRPRRLPFADKYTSMGDIPKEVWEENGFYDMDEE